MNAKYEIPKWMIEVIDELPKDRGIGLLIRHSVRKKLPENPKDSVSEPITIEGWNLARRLGRYLSGRLGNLYASSITRCKQTVGAIAYGAEKRDFEVVEDQFLGGISILQLEHHLSYESWINLGHQKIYQMLAEGKEPPGFAPFSFSVDFLLQHILSHSDEPGVHVFCTHDFLILTVIARILNYKYHYEEVCPKFLEGAFFWREGDKVAVRYREHKLFIDFLPHLLSEENVLYLGKWYINHIFKGQKYSRFVLAGGAFKPLITGKLPRDLDIWAYSDEDRISLISSMLKKGCLPLKKPPFTTKFLRNGFEVEISDKAQKNDISKVLERFDIGLISMGVEFIPSGDGVTGEYIVMVRPEVWKDLENRALSVIKPLKNWSFAFACLERLRFYSRKLGFRLPPEEENYIFQLFQEKEPKERYRMLRSLFYCRDPKQILNELYSRGLFYGTSSKDIY